MSLYVWVKSAFVNGMPLDHTWVTSYDSRLKTHLTLADVEANDDRYWFCKGDFHPRGVSKQFPSGMLLEAPYFSQSSCLVGFNSESESGTIEDYGIDGVCHQVANQVLFPARVTVSAAKGYRLSSAIYGTYGRPHDQWLRKRVLR